MSLSDGSNSSMTQDLESLAKRKEKELLRKEGRKWFQNSRG